MPFSTFARAAIAAATLTLAACGGSGSTTETEPLATTNMLTPDAREALDARVAAYEGSLQQGDQEALLNYAPPRIVEQLAAEENVSPSRFRKMGGRVAGALGTAVKTVGRFGMEHAIAGRAQDGMSFVLIPTATTTGQGDNAVTEQGIALALMEEGEWYLVRLEDEETESRLRAAYPSLAKVALNRFGR